MQEFFEDADIKTVNLQIKVPKGNYCYDEGACCEHFDFINCGPDNPKGYPSCDYRIGTPARCKIGCLKPDACLGLEEL